MTLHDTWVRLKPGNPYEPILDLFPDGMIPMRDPFELEYTTNSEGKTITLWIVDVHRLNTIQTNCIAEVIATHYNVSLAKVVADAASNGGFAISGEWIEKMLCGAEGMQRTKELADFLETAPQPPSREAWQQFYNSQHSRWIDGDEQPPPLPKRIEDFDPRLRTQELSVALQQNQINQMLQGYSVLDVLTGKAMVDVLNRLNPEDHYRLVGDEWDEDEDDIYE